MTGVQTCALPIWSDIWSLDMLVVVFTFLFIDMFDTVGTLIGVCTRAGLVNKEGKIERLNHAFMADAIATTAGAVLGTSTTTTYVESAAGVAQGGRTGMTAFAIACCFAVTLFFSPLFLSIPSAATAPVETHAPLALCAEAGSALADSLLPGEPVAPAPSVLPVYADLFAIRDGGR